MIFSGLLAFGAVIAFVSISLETSAGDLSIRVSAGVWALVGALIGARAAYVGVHWVYFQTHFAESLQPWLGGLSWPGALAGGVLAIAFMALLKGLPLGHLLDDLLPLLASLTIVTQLGCWSMGCGYGPETSIGLPTLDQWGIWKMRIPLQVIAAILTLALFWWIASSRHRKWGAFPGLATSLGMGGLSLILLVTSLFRADTYPLWNGLRLETWAALLFLGVSVFSGLLSIALARK